MTRKTRLSELVKMPGVGKASGAKKISDIDPHWKDFSALMVALIKYPELLKELPEKVVFAPNQSVVSAIISHERTRILDLIRGKGLPVCEIAKRLDRKQEAVSRDLGILKKFGVIDFEKKGRVKIPVLRRAFAIVPLVARGR